MHADSSPTTTGKSPKRIEKEKPMSPACEAHHLIATIVGPQEIGGRIKTALGLVARRTELPERRVRGLWHKEARAIRAEELDALRRAARAEQRAEINAEISELRARLARLEEQIAMAGPQMGSGAREEMRSPMGGFRGMGREG